MANKSQLMKQLSKALPREPKRDVVAEEQRTSNEPAPIQPLLATKLSVSLYARDLAQLDQIKTFMQTKGFRNIADSEALRLACRAIAINDELIPLYQDMQQEDGRTRRKAS